MHKKNEAERVADNISKRGATTITERDVEILKKALRSVADTKESHAVDIEAHRNKISELEVAMASVKRDADIAAAALKRHNEDLEDMLYRAQNRVEELAAESSAISDEQRMVIGELAIQAQNQTEQIEHDTAYYNTQLDLAQASYDELRRETHQLQEKYDEMTDLYIATEERLKRAELADERGQQFAELAERAINDFAEYKAREAERQHAHDIAQTTYGTCVVTAAMLDTDPTPQKEAIVSAFSGASIDTVYSACDTALRNAKTALKTAARESLTPSMTASFALFMVTSLIATIAAARGAYDQPALSSNRAPFVDTCSSKYNEARTQRGAAEWAAICAKP